ncbi:hypothetical protein BGZ68_001183 [Mortierella alpina]|nr:hypothetical protein BGZ68_001183 [Mortierella alpina]
MDFSEDHHRYQSSDEEDFQESFDQAITLPKPILVWRTGSAAHSPSSPKKCSTLIIGTAFGGSSLLHTIKDKVLLGTLILPGVDLKDNTTDLSSASNASCNIYELRADPTVIIVPCNYVIKDKDSLNFAKVIMSNIQASSYPWLRLLQTAGSTTVTKIPTLEVPNLVQNLGAALMGYCEVRGMHDAYLLLSLQEHVYGKALTTAATLRGLRDGLASLGCPVIANDTDISAAVKQIQDKRVGSNRSREDRLYA